MKARRYVGAMYFLLCLLAKPAAAAPSDTVKFTPTIRFYECPQTFTYRSDCAVKEKILSPQKLDLNIQVLTQRMGQWSLQMTEPVPASYSVIVVRGPVANHREYSVSTETGLPGSPSPFTNARVEFSDAAIPDSFGVSSSTMEKAGKKYITEIRLAEFQEIPAAVPVAGKK
ncbi:MAG: hypothetical protein ACXVB9_02320 [Bdellovibrionota bacterium]